MKEKTVSVIIPVYNYQTTLLEEFANKNNTIIKKGSDIFQSQEKYDGHIWQADTLKKITAYKNTIISYCLEKNLIIYF